MAHRRSPVHGIDLHMGRTTGATRTLASEPVIDKYHHGRRSPEIPVVHPVAERFPIDEELLDLSCQTEPAKIVLGLLAWESERKPFLYLLRSDDFRLGGLGQADERIDLSAI